MDPTQQRRIDELMYQTLDGTKTEQGGWTKGKLGANAILVPFLVHHSYHTCHTNPIIANH
jgi:enolase